MTHLAYAVTLAAIAAGCILGLEADQDTAHIPPVVAAGMVVTFLVTTVAAIAHAVLIFTS